MADARSLAHAGQDGPVCDAALVAAFGLLGKRWNGLVLGVLSNGPLGFADIRRSVGTITDSVLSDRLAELVGADLVARTVTDTRPPGVSYQLTETGQKLVPILDQLAGWAGDHLMKTAGATSEAPAGGC